MNEPQIECFDCMAAACGAHHGFTAKCLGCSARAASRLPHYARVRDAGKLDREYRALLQQFNLTHQQIKAAAAADAIGKTNAALG